MTKTIAQSALAVLVSTVMLTGIAAAQTTTDPGVPNTGVGGDSTVNMVLLGIAALAGIAGVAYLVRSGSDRERIDTSA